MKIEVPQEQINQIVDLYNQGHNRKQIKKELELPFGDSVIKRLLQENGCEIRTNPGAQKGGRKKDEISLEDIEKIIKLYNQGYGLTYISKQMGKSFCQDKVKRILKDNNIKLRDFYEALQVKPDNEVDLRKYKINDDYNFESSNGAWLLGFLTADGYLPITKGALNRVTLTLARIDEEVLYKIKKELEYEGPIYQFESSNGFPASSLSFTSKKIRKQIESYGIVNNKTFKLKELSAKISQEYIIDFIRGFFDGDGSIYANEREKKIGMSFTCASKEFLESIASFLTEKYGVTYPKIYESQRNHIIYDIKYYKKDSLLLGELFYNHSNLALSRKQKKYFELKEKYPMLRY